MNRPIMWTTPSELVDLLLRVDMRFRVNQVGQIRCINNDTNKLKVNGKCPHLVALALDIQSPQRPHALVIWYAADNHPQHIPEVRKELMRLVR